MKLYFISFQVYTKLNTPLYSLNNYIKKLKKNIYTFVFGELFQIKIMVIRIK